MGAHTPPELATERKVCGRILRMIRADPCRHCVHRIEGWGRVTCSLAGRRYPQCMSDGRALQFQLDEATIRRAA